MTEVYPTFPQTRFFLMYKQAFEAQQVVEFEDRYQADRVDDWFHVTVTPITDGIAIATQIITERKKAEEALKASEARLSSVFENSMDAILLTAPDGRIFKANSFAQRMLGMTEQEILQAGRQGIAVPDECLAKAIKERNEKGRANAELTVRRKDGSTLSVEVTSSLFIDSDGSTKTSMMFRDITERKKAEEALKESRALYKTLFENTDDAFELVEPIFNINGEIVNCRMKEVNAAYERQVGIKRNDVVGKLFTEINPNIERKWIQSHGTVAKTGKSLRTEIYDGLTKRWFDLYLFPFGKGLVGTLLRDITYRKDLEKQLQDKEKLAVIGATAGMVGHDIRNPLQAITGDLYLLKDDINNMPDAESKQSAIETIDAISENIDYINKIVSDLQDYARPLKPTAKQTDLTKTMTALLESSNIPKNIKPNLQIETGANQIVSDVDLLKRIFTNLITNAVQAMPKGGKLTITATKTPDNTIVISVGDTGVGIPPEIRANLFTPTFTTKSKGQGFGLAVVKRLAEALGGTVSFESEVGKGTTFIVCLPPQGAKR